MNNQINNNMSVDFNTIVNNMLMHISSACVESKKHLLAKVTEGVECVAGFYSNIMGEEIDSVKTLHILNAQAAFLGILLTSCSPLLCLGCVAWFAMSLKGCRNVGM